MQAKHRHTFFPFFCGVAILILLLFKLPGVATQFSPFECPKCTLGSPVITWMGAGYFAALLTLIVSYPRFFSRAVCSVGILWAIAMGTFLLWFSPDFCYICFFSHLLHVCIWGYFLVFPHKGFRFTRPFAAHFVTAVQMGLLTTVAYWGIDTVTYHLGDRTLEKTPQFAFTTLSGETISSKELGDYHCIVLQFVLPKCHYCKEQLPILSGILEEWKGKKIGVFNIVANRRNADPQDIEGEIHELAPNIPIVVDDGFELGRKFHIRSFPTIIILDRNGRIVHTLVGRVPDLKQELHRSIR